VATSAWSAEKQSMLRRQKNFLEISVVYAAIIANNPFFHPIAFIVIAIIALRLL
jgi:hypothetical protein